MPRLNTAGSAAMGIAGGQISIDGSVPAALAAVVGGETCWYTTTKIAYQDATAAPAAIKSYDVGTFAIATLASQGETGLGAGNSQWAAFLAGSGVTTSVGAGPFPQGGPVDVSETGVVGLMTYYALGKGISIYSAVGAPLASIGATLFYTTFFLRSGVLAYSVNSGGSPLWLLSDFNGAGISYSPRTESINWLIPVTLASAVVWVVERSTRLTIRQKDASTGFVIEDTIPQFNPDAREISPGVVRVAWSSDAGESPGALIVVDVTLATGANTRGTVVAGALVFVAQTAFASVSLPTGAPASGGGSGGGGGSVVTTRGGVIVTRPVKAAPPPPTRTYPEVNRITDQASQKSLRLLWDKVYSVAEAADALNEQVRTIQATHIEDLRAQVATLNERTRAFGALGPGSGAGGGGGSGIDGSGGELGCSSAGATGHVTAGSPMTTFTMGQICCGTGNEYPALLAIVANQAARDANRLELLGRMIWHLALAGFKSDYYPNNPFTLLIELNNFVYAYRVTDYATYDIAMFTTMVFGGADPGVISAPAGGISD